MKKPLFTRITRLSSRTHLGRLLHWNVRKDFLAEVGPLQYQLDQLDRHVDHLGDFMQRRTCSLSEELIQMDKIFHKDLVKLSIAYAFALLIVSLGCLIGFLVN